MEGAGNVSCVFLLTQCLPLGICANYLTISLLSQVCNRNKYSLRPSNTHLWAVEKYPPACGMPGDSPDSRHTSWSLCRCWASGQSDSAASSPEFHRQMCGRSAGV